MIFKEPSSEQIIANLRSLVTSAKTTTPESMQKLEQELGTFLSAISTTLEVISRMTSGEKTRQIEHKEVRATIEQWVAVAVLGMLRIYHTQLNAYLKTHADHAQPDGDWTHALNSIEAVRNEWMSTNPIGYTITGDPILWNLEFAQDQIRTLELSGQDAEAIQLAQQAERISTILLDESTLTSDERTAILSAMAVVYMRWGSVTGSQHHFAKSLESMQNNPDDRNYARQNHIAKQAAYHAITDWRKGEILSRINNLIDGSRRYLATRNRN